MLNSKSLLDQALAKAGICLFQEYKAAEAADQLPPIKRKTQARIVDDLEYIVKLLKEGCEIISREEMARAKELEEKEPQFIAVAEHNQALMKELKLLKDRQAKGNEMDLDELKAKTQVGPKTKPTKKTSAGKISSKTPRCAQCGKTFKSNAGLARHVKSCKG
jgi:hypothetical protein